MLRVNLFVLTTGRHPLRWKWTMSSSLQLSDVIGLVQSALNVRMPITHVTTSLFPKLSRVQLPLCSAPSPTFWDRFLGSFLFCGRSDAWRNFHFRRPNVLRPPNLRCDRFCDGVHSINRQTFNDRQMFFGHQTFNDRQTFCDRSPLSQVDFAAVRTALLQPI